MYKHVHSYIHTRDRSAEDCIHTHSHTHTQHLASVCVCARRCAATRQHDTRNRKKNKWRKTISTSASPPSSIQRRKTTTRNGSSRGGENGGDEIDVIRDVDGIEDEIIKAFHLSLQSKDENHSESIINLKKADTQLLSLEREIEAEDCLLFYQ